MSGYEELAKSRFQFIRGIEWTTFFGHMVVLVLTGEDRFARVEAEGVVDGKECTVCLSAPVYLS